MFRFCGLFFLIIFNFTPSINAGPNIPFGKYFPHALCEGDYLDFIKRMPNTVANGWDPNNLNSSYGLEGLWAFYEHVDYNANGLANWLLLGSYYLPGESPTDDKYTCFSSNLNHSSARLVGSAVDYHTLSVTFFDQWGFQGQDAATFEHSPTIPIRPISMILMGNQPWTLYTSKYFGGNSYCILPGEAPYCTPVYIFNIEEELGMGDGLYVESAKLGCDDAQKIVHIEKKEEKNIQIFTHQ